MLEQIFQLKYMQANAYLVCQTEKKSFYNHIFIPHPRNVSLTFQHVYLAINPLDFVLLMYPYEAW